MYPICDLVFSQALIANSRAAGRIHFGTMFDIGKLIHNETECSNCLWISDIKWLRYHEVARVKQLEIPQKNLFWGRIFQLCSQCLEAQ